MLLDYDFVICTETPISEIHNTHARRFTDARIGNAYETERRWTQRFLKRPYSTDDKTIKAME